MRIHVRQLARRRRVAALAIAIFTMTALGVSVGVAQAGTAFQGRAAADRGLAAGRVLSRVAGAAVVAPAESCATLGQADFSALPGASTTIVSATTVPASGNTLGNYAGCEVTGLIAPQIQFQLMLPTQNYQGKYLQLGCGGYCGTDTLGTPAASYGCVPVTPFSIKDYERRDTGALPHYSFEMAYVSAGGGGLRRVPSGRQRRLGGGDRRPGRAGPRWPGAPAA